MSTAPREISDVESLHRQIPHSVWLEGPAYSPQQIGVSGWRYDAYTSALNTLSPHVLILYLSGRTSVRRWGRGFTEQALMQTGDLSLHPAQTPARWAWPQPIQVLHIYFTPHQLQALGREIYGEALGRLQVRSQLRFEEPALLALGRGLIEELSASNQIGAQIAAEAVGNLILVHLLRRHVTRAPNPAPSGALERARAYVTAHLGEAFTLQDLADHVGLSRHHLCRVFRTELNESPMSFVRSQRAQAARRLLESSGLALSEIAYQLGFADQSHLTRCFKAFYGRTPGQWRHRQRRGEAPPEG